MKIRMTKSEFRNKSQSPISKLFFLMLVIISSFWLGHWSFPAGAMGSRPPVKKEPKYKLEILKMEFISAPEATREVKATKKTSGKLQKKL